VYRRAGQELAALVVEKRQDKALKAYVREAFQTTTK
jgi:hypothetical protein